MNRAMGSTEPAGPSGLADRPLDRSGRPDRDGRSGGLGRRDRLDLVIAFAIAAAATLFHLLYFNHGVRNWVDLGVAAHTVSVVAAP